MINGKIGEPLTISLTWMTQLIVGFLISIRTHHNTSFEKRLMSVNFVCGSKTSVQFRSQVFPVYILYSCRPGHLNTNYLVDAARYI